VHRLHASGRFVLQPPEDVVAGPVVGQVLAARVVDGAQDLPEAAALVVDGAARAAAGTDGGDDRRRCLDVER
jgi:hypothetical protein